MYAREEHLERIVCSIFGVEQLVVERHGGISVDSRCLGGLSACHVHPSIAVG
jgi:hypothetical protein